MAWFYRVCRVKVLFAVAVLAIGASVAQSAAGKDPPKPPVSKPDSKPAADPGSAGYVSGQSERDKLVASAREMLDGFKPTFGAKGDGDFFVIGTIRLENRHATVDIVIKEGLQQAAEYIADFQLGKKKGVICIDHVFGRAKNTVAAEAMLAQSKAKSVEEQLANFKLSVKGKKSPDDYFVAGTADVNNTTLNADIRFEVLSGVKDTADFLINFVYTLPQDHRGEWHVFYRAPTEALATDYRQQMRDWYDTLQSQRSEIANIYKAKTTRRC